MGSVIGCKKYHGISARDAICVRPCLFVEPESVIGMRKRDVVMMIVRIMFP